MLSRYSLAVVNQYRSIKRTNKHCLLSIFSSERFLVQELSSEGSLSLCVLFEGCRSGRLAFAPSLAHTYRSQSAHTHTYIHTPYSFLASMASQSQSELNNALFWLLQFDGSITELQSLLDRHANIDARTIDGDTPLHVASSAGQHQCILLLLDRHADIHARNKYKRTPLHLASSAGQHQCIELLLDRHADLNARAIYGDTPLHYASDEGHHQCIELLLDRHANVNARNKYDRTSLHLASLKGHHQCIELLLDRHADVHARNENNATPLHLASWQGSHQCIELLIDHCADKSLVNVRHCVLSHLLARSCNLNILSASHILTHIYLFVLLSISQPSDVRRDSRTSHQEARDCSIDSRSRCATILSQSLSMSQSLSLWRSIRSSIVSLLTKWLMSNSIWSLMIAAIIMMMMNVLQQHHLSQSLCGLHRTITWCDRPSITCSRRACWSCS